MIQSSGRALGSNAGTGPRTFMVPLGATLLGGLEQAAAKASKETDHRAKSNLPDLAIRTVMGCPLFILFLPGGEKNVLGLQPFPGPVGEKPFGKAGMVKGDGFLARQ